MKAAVPYSPEERRWYMEFARYLVEQYKQEMIVRIPFGVSMGAPLGRVAMLDNPSWWGIQRTIKFEISANPEAPLTPSARKNSRKVSVRFRDPGAGPGPDMIEDFTCPTSQREFWTDLITRASEAAQAKLEAKTREERAATTSSRATEPTSH